MGYFISLIPAVANVFMLDVTQQMLFFDWPACG